MWRLLSHLVLLATASASLVISEIADKGAADAAVRPSAASISKSAAATEPSASPPKKVLELQADVLEG